MIQMQQLVGGLSSAYKKYVKGDEKGYTPSTSSNAKTKHPKRLTARPISTKNYCAACDEVLAVARDPRALECKHAFCSSCLNNMVFVRQPEYIAAVKCPTCQRFTTLDQKEGVKGLPQSIPAHQHVEDEERTKEISRKLESSESQLDIKEIDDDDLEEFEEDFVIMKNQPLNVSPTSYIPFSSNEETCKTFFEQWLNEIWFPPSDLTENKTMGPLRPVYVPFYIFTVDTETSFRCDIGKTMPEGHDHWTNISGHLENHYSELMTCASYSVNRSLVTTLLKTPGSFVRDDMDRLSSHFHNVQLGVQLDHEVVDIDFGADYAFELAGKRIMDEGDFREAKKKIKREYQPEKKKNLHVSTQVVRRDFSVVLLPIYFTGFSYGGVTYDVVISGNRGTVVGDRPYGSGMLGKLMTEGWNKIQNYSRKQQ
eukprot:TRINITY_DN2328_c0_g1_i3.p1 TRINITY_DN2328_c0_g1~~TRINITY_DN2328_c0_g1_i3.p1  ORF type:complete len:424 (-),score=64.24 TRINITY_DN2328_c0_g1_i3:42-1313(-)